MTAAAKSIRYAASYEGRLVNESDDALLWFIPTSPDPPPGAIAGIAAWVPRALVVTAIDEKRGPLDPPGPLGLLTTTIPFQGWERAELRGSSLTWLGSRRRAS